MHIVDYFYSLNIKNNTYKERKLQLPVDTSFTLTGARGSGKSTLLIEHLNSLLSGSWLYIDCQDPIFALEDIDSDSLQEFISAENISTLALDHYYDGFLDTLPVVNTLIIVSTMPTQTGFVNYRLYPLDYEEFLGFQKNISPASSFNHFLKAGTLPMIASSSIDSTSLSIRTLFHSTFDEDESRLMLILAKYQGRRVTTNQLYTHAKEYFRISKDWVYKTVKRFKDEELILFVEDIESKGAQKMILYDFALPKYLSKTQPFHITFDSMVVLALFKHGIDFKSIGSSGYLVHDNELVLPAAFESEESFWKKAYDKVHLYKRYNINKVTIVSVSSSYSFALNNIQFNATPFYEWSTLND